MKTITIEIPNEINMLGYDLKLFLATKLYEAGKVSLGNAAVIVGLSKRAFTEILGKYNVSLFNHPPDDILEDLQNVETQFA